MVISSIVILLHFTSLVNGFNQWRAIQQDDQATPLDFTGYKVLRINPRSEDNFLYLHRLYLNSSIYNLDFWQPPTHRNAIVDVAIPPEEAQFFIRDLEMRQIDYSIAINDLQSAIRNERDEPTGSGNAQQDSHLRFDRYNTLDQIEEYYFRIREEHPKLVSIVEIGQTYENRSIYLLKLGKKPKIRAAQESLSSKSVDNMAQKPAIWIDAGIHAREWISPAVALTFVDKLLTYYGADQQIQAFLDHIDWYILPVMNPDGYAFSHKRNRMWRKNRRPSQCIKTPISAMCCTGVDLNRNFDWFWGTTGSSSDPCHDTYHGLHSFSENESKAVKDFLQQNPVKLFVTMHSYSQLWLIPYGHRKKSYPHDYHTILRPLAMKAVKALSRLYGTNYQVGTGADLMYEASGASHDYAKGTLQIPYSYLLELRPQNTMFANGFLLPEREIQPTGEETFEAIKVLAQEIYNEVEHGNKTPLPPTPLPYTTTPTTTTTVEVEEITEEPTQPPTVEVTSTTTELPTPPIETESPVDVLVTSATTKQSVTASPEGPTVAPPITQIPETSEETNVIVPNRIIRCTDHGRYCKWWKIHNLCEKERVRRLCSLSCLPECKV
ncbi:Peptidase-M14 domain-containing protein [Aphelenchoides besseyi]|nr:Peptidase-M14 domain-containing protein [Aphelenchoides besseyi]